MKKITLTIDTRMGPMEVRGFVACPGLAIHRKIVRMLDGQAGPSFRRDWSVTHIPTGLQIHPHRIRFELRADAERYALCLSEHCDWSKLKKDVSRNHRAAKLAMAAMQRYEEGHDPRGAG